MSKLDKKLAGKQTKLARAGEKQATPSPPARAGRYLEIETEKLFKNPWQPRQEFDQAAIDELAASIKEHGVLQPLLVSLNEFGRATIIAGERRYRAARQAKLATVPCIVSDGDPAVLALIENLHREDLTPLEEAWSLVKLKQERDYKLEDLAKITGKAKSTISEILKLANLPPDVKEQVAKEPAKYPKRLLTELAKEKDPDAVRQSVAQVATGQAEPDKLRTELRRERAEAKAKTKHKKRKEPRRKEGPSPSDKAAERVEQLAYVLAGLPLQNLNYRQRGVLRKALKGLAKTTDPIFHFLKQAALEDSKKMTPEDRARLLAELRKPSDDSEIFQRAAVRRRFWEEGKEMCAVEFADQHALALQEKRAREAEGGE